MQRKQQVLTARFISVQDLFLMCRGEKMKVIVINNLQTLRDLFRKHTCVQGVRLTSATVLAEDEYRVVRSLYTFV